MSGNEVAKSDAVGFVVAAPRALKNMRGLTLPFLAVLGGSGCVTTLYQPMIAIQRPVVVDPQMPNNFTDTDVLVRCHPSDAVDANALCRNLRSSLSKQGAKVTTEVVRPNGRAATSKVEERAPQFVIDVTSKITDVDEPLLLRLLNIATLTLVPTWDSTTYLQEIRVRDAQGFVLAQQTLQERFVTAFGFGFWAVNALVDLIFRPKDQQITGDGYKTDFTADFHRHIAQTLYNAKQRSRVMNSFESKPTEPAKGVSP